MNPETRTPPAWLRIIERLPRMIIYEDSKLLVLNKPAGMPSIPLNSEETGTAVHSALAHFPGLRNIGRGGLEPGILHRLDTGTSGLLVFAKTNEYFDFLQQHWKTDRVRKWYRAICSPKQKDGSISPPDPLPPGEISFPLGHSAKSSKKMICIHNAAALRQIRGKALAAKTLIQEVKVIDEQARRLDLFIEIRTGVMHQIRCHLASVNWPIDGDLIYKGRLADRLWLHAWRIELPLLPTAHKREARLLLEARLPLSWPV